MQSLENPAAHNAVFDLGGPQPLSPPEVVALFEKTSCLIVCNGLGALGLLLLIPALWLWQFWLAASLPVPAPK